MARHCSTICLPICKEDYLDIVDSPTHYRAWIDQAFRGFPELFPKDFAPGYTLKDCRFSTRLKLRVRRIRCTTTKQSFSVRPSFVMPYMVGWTDDVEGPLFLRAFGV